MFSKICKVTFQDHNILGCDACSLAEFADVSEKRTASIFAFSSEAIVSYTELPTAYCLSSGTNIRRFGRSCNIPSAFPHLSTFQIRPSLGPRFLTPLLAPISDLCPYIQTYI
jgi:hypothetical protein